MPNYHRNRIYAENMNNWYEELKGLMKEQRKTEPTTLDLLIAVYGDPGWKNFYKTTKEEIESEPSMLVEEETNIVWCQSGDFDSDDWQEEPVGEIVEGRFVEYQSDHDIWQLKQVASFKRIFGESWEIE